MKEKSWYIIQIKFAKSNDTTKIRSKFV